jgi:O-glycosyl hydrolase
MPTSISAARPWALTIFQETGILMTRLLKTYDETPEDYALEHFSISNDLETLVPIIKNALKYQPELKLWASPWSPPTCRYTWTLLKKFLENGVSAYHYWNISLKERGISRWGWAQNSLVTIDTVAKTLVQNDLGQELPIRVKVAGKVIGATLEADSFNTFVVRT